MGQGEEQSRGEERGSWEKGWGQPCEDELCVLEMGGHLGQLSHCTDEETEALTESELTLGVGWLQSPRFHCIVAPHGAGPFGLSLVPP